MPGVEGVSSESLVQALDQPLALVDVEGRIRMANVAFRRTFGGLDRSFEGVGIGELVNAEDREAFRSLFGESGPRQSLVKAERNEGTMFHFQARAASVGEGIYLLSVSHLDEPGSRLIPDGLFQHAVESANDAIIITTPQLNDLNPMIQYVNSAFTRMTGYSVEEVVGKTPRILQGPKTSRALMERLRRDLEKTGFFVGETINYRKDGTEYAVEWRISPLQSENGETTHWVAIQRDATERVRQEERIKALNEELEKRVQERTNELQAANRELETFNYSVSHDLRAPLRSILGFGSALKEDYGDQLGADGLDYIERMTKAARRMDELITAILGLSRLARAKMTRSTVDISEIAQAVGRDQSKTYPSVDFSVQEGIVANADPGLARAVVGNLLENAFKFSARGDSPEVRVETEERDGRTYVKVADNGIGFDPKYTERIFESFERLHTEAEYPGTGIGLATVLRVVRRHGGDVIGESVPGKGATFLVWFGEPDASDS